MAAVAELPLGGFIMRRLLNVFEGGDHNIAKQWHHFDQLEDAIDSSQRDSFLVIHLVYVALTSVHQVKTETDYLFAKERKRVSGVSEGKEGKLARY